MSHIDVTKPLEDFIKPGDARHQREIDTSKPLPGYTFPLLDPETATDEMLGKIECAMTGIQDFVEKVVAGRQREVELEAALRQLLSAAIDDFVDPVDYYEAIRRAKKLLVIADDEVTS